MSAVITEVQQNNSTRTTHSPPVVRREGFYLMSREQPLFTWLHTDSGSQSMHDHGVVICPPLGHEQLHSHRTLRHLADLLAERGIPTMRFDWHGTGDSAGNDDDPGRTETWQANLKDVVAWMRDELGCQRISIVGLRMGATLAALACQELEIENLVLWAPVTKGRAYIREMMALDRTSEYQSASGSASSGEIEAAGFVLSASTAAELSEMSLLNSRPQCQRMLLVGRDDLPKDQQLHDRYAAAGIALDYLAVPGYTEMLAEPHRGQVPDLAITLISTWLQAKVLAESSSEMLNAMGVRGTRSTTLLHRPETALSFHRGVYIQERTVKLSSDPDLFGILTEPPGGAIVHQPLVVLLNAGAAYRIGPGRLHVHLGRQLAAEGFRCLRLDLNGLGDSIAAGPELENEPYAPTMFRDIEVVLQKLQQDWGVKQVILMGLCSGAYAAFQSATCVTNPVLVQSVMINPLTFHWKAGMSVDDKSKGQPIAQHYYLGSASKLGSWWRLLTGQSQIGIGGAVRLLTARLGLAEPEKSSATADCVSAEVPCAVGHPGIDDLPRDLATVTARGRKLAMFFAKGDPGYSILTFKANRQQKIMQRNGMLQVTFIKDADHTFSRKCARKELVGAVSGYLKSKFAD